MYLCMHVRYVAEIIVMHLCKGGEAQFIEFVGVVSSELSRTSSSSGWREITSIWVEMFHPQFVMI